MSAHERLLDLQREIYRAAQSIGRPVPQVMPWVIEPRNLQAAWQRVAEADGAKTPGPDGLTVRDVAARKDRWLNQLSGQLYRGTFRGSPPRRVAVPKSHGGGLRQLGILNVADRVVHAALKQVLEPLLEPDFAPGSFGFRPGRSVPSALLTAVRTLNGPPPATLAAPSEGNGVPAPLGPTLPYPYVCKLDIADCFDTIEHGILLQRLQTVVSDPAAIELVGQLLAVGGHGSGWWRRRAVGVIQGSSLSPLLCNFYLDPLDRGLAELGHRSGGGVVSLRYADDLLILARTRRLARQAWRVARRVAGRSGQRLKAHKSLIGTAERGVRWLGVDLAPRRASFGPRREFTYYVPDEKLDAMCQRIREMTEPPSARIDPTAFDLGRWLLSINDQLRDWWQAYMFADNGLAVFRHLDEFTFERVRQLLYALTGLRRRALQDEYQQYLPRGFRTWRIGGTQLVVLSSLAPRSPSHLVRRPEWMVDKPRAYAAPARRTTRS